MEIGESREESLKKALEEFRNKQTVENFREKAGNIMDISELADDEEMITIPKKLLEEMGERSFDFILAHLLLADEFVGIMKTINDSVENNKELDSEIVGYLVGKLVMIYRINKIINPEAAEAMKKSIKGTPLDHLDLDGDGEEDDE